MVNVPRMQPVELFNSTGHRPNSQTVNDASKETSKKQITFDAQPESDTIRTGEFNPESAPPPNQFFVDADTLFDHLKRS